jgi:copper transporter 1
MLWNWYTVDACFISSTWHIRSRGVFAASCVGVILLVLSLEMVRRAEREYDRYLQGQRSTALFENIDSGDHTGTPGSGGSKTAILTTIRERAGGSTPRMQIKWWQQGIRSLLYMTQFAVGYMVMLLAMYYNGEDLVFAVKTNH